MISPLIKLALLAIIVLVGINFFSPDKASEITSVISETTGIKKNNIDKKLNSTTEFVKESSKAVVDIAKKKIEESK